MKTSDLNKFNKRVYLDFETRSEVDVRATGAYIYARHPSTDIVCMAYKIGCGKVKVIDNFEHMPKDFQAALEDPSYSFVAHNCAFEAQHYGVHLMQKRGWPNIDYRRWIDTAAKTAAFALPRSLEEACNALDLDIKKNMDGRKIMLKFCKPQKKTTKHKDDIPEEHVIATHEKENSRFEVTYWYHDEQDKEKLMQYCVDDVKATHNLDLHLPDLSEAEQKVWQYDYVINSRGVRVDTKAIHILINHLEKREKELLDEIPALTEGVIQSPRQVGVSLVWLNKRGAKLKNLTKDAVLRALEDNKEMTLEARRFLEIRKMLSKSSVKKLEAMLRRGDENGVIQGAFMYHGASTGRWAGQGIQPHNFPRTKMKEEELNSILEMDLDTLEREHGPIFFVASSALRGMIVPKPGNVFICSDFSAIESRGLGWITGEQNILQAYAEEEKLGLPSGHLYRLTASRIYGVPPDEVNDDQRLIGKVATLALGYQGWVKAFLSMAEGYSVYVSEDEAMDIAGRWRENHPAVVRYWEKIEQTARMAVLNLQRAYSFRGVKFGMKKYNGFEALHCKLPSGRLLTYLNPRIEEGERNGIAKRVITFDGVNGYTRKWERIATYGGKLTENIVQALCRDILVEAMQRLERYGYKISLHVHDEVVAEISEENEKLQNVEQFEKIMAVVPKWAEGMPIGVSGGWIGKRYKKN